MLDTEYGFTFNPKEQFFLDQFRFKTIFSVFFNFLHCSSFSYYKFYPEISNPLCSKENKYDRCPRLHFHGTIKFTHISHLMEFYQFDFYKLAKLGSIEIHYKINPSYPTKNKVVM